MSKNDIFDIFKITCSLPFKVKFVFAIDNLSWLLTNCQLPYECVMAIDNLSWLLTISDYLSWRLKICPGYWKFVLATKNFHGYWQLVLTTDNLSWLPTNYQLSTNNFWQFVISPENLSWLLKICSGYWKFVMATDN